MNYEQFKKLIEKLEALSDRSSSLYALKIDLMDYNDDFNEVISGLMLSVFGECGKDWIDWYLYERVSHSGEILKAWDENNNEICYDIESLWETVKEYITIK